MKHLFVPYELALKLKEKGFDEPCLRVYCERYEINPKTGGDIKTGEFYLTDKPSAKALRCKAPLYQQVIDWFRETHKIHIAIVGDDDYQYQFEINTWHWYEIEKSHRVGHHVLGETLWHTRSESFKSYYEALNKAIEEALKLI